MITVLSRVEDDERVRAEARQNAFTVAFRRT
jgi:hypothetical protein